MKVNGTPNQLVSVPFVIFSLPRSRSFWISKFLTYGDWQCGHDEIRHARSLEDVESWLAQPSTGTVETAAAPFWRLLRHYQPDTRIVTIRRPVEDVLRSLCEVFRRTDPELALPLLRKLDRKLDQIEAHTDAYRVEYADLQYEEVCAGLFEYCLPYDYDPRWWHAMQGLNLQVNLYHVLRYMQAHRHQLERVAQQAKHRLLTLLERPVELEGVTYQLETLETFHRDAEALAREQLVQWDQSPLEYETKNWDVHKVLEGEGKLQIMTARSNGRMFGYLVSVLGPDFDDKDKIIASHTIFMTSPLFRNLGLKLQRAALEALRARGVAEVQMGSGHRGAGSRIGALYRRLGARETGRLYCLDLGD